MNASTEQHHPRAAWRDRLRRIIFEADTPAGKTFDVVLIWAIILSVLVVSLDTVEAYHNRFGDIFYGIEWFFTLIFTVEYALRLLTAPSAGRYSRSFFGVVDLLAVLPSYVGLLLPGSQYLMVVRGLRVIRVFRVLKLMEYVGEANVLRRALRASRYKITVFILTVLVIVLFVGALMYLIEGPEHGFTSIPRAAYWGIVTLTTVGYGDIAPETPLGQALAAMVMIMGYGIIAVPTGIVTVELNRAAMGHTARVECPGCGSAEHAMDASYCRLCGGELTQA